MEKVERRFRAGHLTHKDLVKWTKSDSPKRSYKLVSNLWDTNFKQPEIVPGNYTMFDYRQPDRIFLNPETIVEHREDLEKVGVDNPSLDYILMPDLAQEFTRYINYRHVPSNFEKQDILRGSRPFEVKYDEVIDSAAIGSQIRGIGFIGGDFVANEIGIKNHKRIQQEIIEMIHKDENSDLKKLLYSDYTDLISKARNSLLPPDAEENLSTIIFSMFFRSIIGAGIVKISDDLKEEYGERFPKLVRKELEPEEKYRNAYLDFIESYIPNLNRFLLEVCY